jgi:hypothetical protein
MLLGDDTLDPESFRDGVDQRQDGPRWALHNQGGPSEKEGKFYLNRT